MSSGKGGKGKFINAFQSIQMISDYVEAEGPKEVPKLETKVISVSEQFTTNTTQPPFNVSAPVSNPFQPFSVSVGQPYGGGNQTYPVESTQPSTNSNNLQDEIDKFVSETNSLETLQNGDELYNPLEDMDEGSDMDESQMIISNSPNVSSENDTSFAINSTRKEEDLNSTMSYNLPPYDQSSIYPHTNTIELPSTFELPTSFSSPSSSDGENDDDTGVERTRLSDHVSERDVSQRDVSQRDISQRDMSQRDMSERDMSERDMSERDMSERDMSQRDMSERDMSERDMSERDMSERDVSERDVSERDVSERDVSERDTIERDTIERDTIERDIMERDIIEEHKTPEQTTPGQNTPQQNTPEQNTPEHDTPEYNIESQIKSESEVDSEPEDGISSKFQGDNMIETDRNNDRDTELFNESNLHREVPVKRDSPKIDMGMLYEVIDDKEIIVFNEDEIVPPPNKLQEISGNELSSKEEEVDKQQDEKIMKELEESTNVADISSNQVDFIDDNDELLGTALAELEQEEKEAEEELKKKLTKVKGAIKKVKKKKKKKTKNKIKNKDTDKKEVNKDEKKKKKKKKKKLKDKDKGEEVTIKKEKKKKKADKKLKDEKRGPEISISSVIKELNKEAKEKKSEPKKSKSSKIIKIEEIPIVKTVSKEKKKDERRHKNRDKKQDRKLYDRSNSIPERIKERKVVKEKKIRKEGKENKDKSRRGRKRPSRDSSVEVERKRSRKEASPERSHKKRSRKEESSKSRRRSKRSVREDSSEERERRRSSHSDLRKTASLKEVSPKEVDYQIRLPPREKLHEHRKVKEETPPKLSKEEFYEIQSKVRKLRGGKEDTRKHHVEDTRKVRENHEESARKIRENHEESRKFRESLDDSHKSQHHENVDESSRKHRDKHEVSRKVVDNFNDTQRLRENLEEIRSFREKMNDSRKIRDSLEERKLRDHLLSDTRKLYEAINDSRKQRESIEDLRKHRDDIEDLRKVKDNREDSRKLSENFDDMEENSRKLLEPLNETRKSRDGHDDSRKISEKNDDSRKHVDKSSDSRKIIDVLNESQKHNKSRETRDVRKKVEESSASDDDGTPVEDTKLTRSSLRENYSRELNKYRREHERSLKINKEIRKQQRKERENQQVSPEQTERRSNNRPKSPPSPPPPPPPKRIRNDSFKSTGSSNPNQTTYMRSHSVSSVEDHVHENTENIVDERERSSVFVEEKLDDDEKHIARIDEEKTNNVNGRLEIDLNHNSMSPSEGEEVHDSDSQKEMKPGFVSLRQYKQRKKSEQKANQKIHRRKSSSSSSQENKEPLEPEIYEKRTTESEVLPETNEEPPQRLSISPIPQEEDKESNEEIIDPIIEDVGIDIEEGIRAALEDTNEKIKTPRSDEDTSNVNDTSIPLLSNEDSQEMIIQALDSTWKEPAINLSDIEVVPSPMDSPEDSPYNPEFASPFDIGTPALAEDDDDNIDFRAYKDVVAFNDIMKSKVKQHARKQKRRKLEEMKFDLDGRGGSRKERKLVDHLIRQAQVEEEMKNVLKQYFRSRDITKDEYKNILKKAVPQVTMSNSPIIPEKIQSLMVKFVRKCKGQRMKEDKSRRRHQQELAEQQKELQLQLQANAAMLDSLQPFQQIRVLNPNLPLPPL